MIQLIIAFLISIGFNIGPDNTDAVTVTEQGNENYGIVITDDVGTVSKITLIYDEATGTFEFK